MNKFLACLLFFIVSCAADAKVIVVLGDSISASYGIEVQQGWVALLQDKLKQVNSDYTIVNESISGETTIGGLARINSALQRHKPAIVLLELGANDGLRGLSPMQMKANLAELIRRSQAADAEVLLLAMKIPPNYGKRYTDLFENVYRDLAREYQVVLVPFIMQDVALHKQLMQKDGFHPNQRAQPIIAGHVWKYLAPLVAPQ